MAHRRNPKHAPAVVYFCQGCHNEGPKEFLTLKDCSCSYCHKCLEIMFSLALRDEEASRPHCCYGPITLKTAKSHLPKPLANEYSSRLVEMNTKNKVYCANNLCNCFIAPHSIHNNQAHCQKCQRTTCVKCKEPGHFGPCTSETYKALAALAKEESWQTCPDCFRMVEKIDGCNYMECRCHCQFCYLCGRHADKCRCGGVDDH